MVSDEREPETIREVLDAVDGAGDGEERVAVSEIVDEIGDSAFAPLMLVPALIMVSPATAMFGVATICGLGVALIALQMVIGRERLWLPGFVRNRSVSRRHLDTAVRWLSRPARLVDSLTRKRLGRLTTAPFDRLWALICMTAALMVPVFELVPMSATIIGAAITLFGLAMVAKDGLLVLFGITVLGGAGWLLWSVAT